MTITVDAEGFVRGYEVGRRSYRELQHPAISNTLAGAVLACPEDAWRITQGRVRRAETGAMAGGTLLDSLITGPEWSPHEGSIGLSEYVYKSGKQKGETSVVTWQDWNGLRIVNCEDFTGQAAKNAKAEAKALGLTVITASDFDKERAIATELRVRFELAGFRIEDYLTQVSLYWVETARNGRKVQACGRLDFLKKDWSEVVDLKRVESLSNHALERHADTYKWARQASAYTRGIVALRPDLIDCYAYEDTGDCHAWKWLFARTEPVVACTLRPTSGLLLKTGEAAWNRAVNEWAEGLETGLWRGHESDHTPLMPTSWAVEQMEADLV